MPPSLLVFSCFCKHNEHAVAARIYPHLQIFLLLLLIIILLLLIIIIISVVVVIVIVIAIVNMNFLECLISY